MPQEQERLRSSTSVRSMPRCWYWHRRMCQRGRREWSQGTIRASYGCGCQERRHADCYERSLPLALSSTRSLPQPCGSNVPDFHGTSNDDGHQQQEAQEVVFTLSTVKCLLPSHLHNTVRPAPQRSRALNEISLCLEMMTIGQYGL